MKFAFFYFFFIFFTLAFFSSGVLDSEDSWLYVSVAKNIYYNHEITAAPNEYAQRKNVNFNATLGADGKWRTSQALGYSIAMVPAVALSDVVHRYYGVPSTNHFPLEHDWTLHFFASFTNSFLAALLAVYIYFYGILLGLPKKSALILSLFVTFATIVMPMSKLGFAQMLFTSALVATWYHMTRWLKLSERKDIVFFCVTFGTLILSYNSSYLLTIPPLALYVYLVLLKKYDWLAQHHKRNLLFLVIGGIVCSFLFFSPSILSVLEAFRPKALFEGVWGFLLSPGKSVFLYNPPLIILLIFWYKIPKKYMPETISWIFLAFLYLFVYGSARLREDVYIWHGGMGWGARYIFPLVPFFAMLAYLTTQRLSSLQRKLVWYPFIALSIFIQIIGSTIPYLVQYRSLPYNIFINKMEILHYDYASFLPRYSPLILMLREFKTKLRELPLTIDHGDYKARLVDGFNPPLKIGNGAFRGIQRQGYLEYQQQKSRPLKSIALSLYNAPDNPSIGTYSALLQLKLNEHQIEQDIIIPSQKDVTSRLQIPDGIEKQADNLIEFSVQYIGTSSAHQVLYVKSLAFNDAPINIRSLDYPDLSALGEKTSNRPYRVFGKERKDLWELWNLRARISEETFDLWWIKNLYYWDRPQNLVWALFCVNVAGIFVTGWYVFRRVMYT
ncbi:MAG: hypothetical protein HZA34_01260 [Candidatus Pacebacteria bacterium]|nr:hypothetical protein [Candidatus Paceibacterota bacterium]